MTEKEKVMLRLGYVTDALSDASGDFVKTQDGWANQTRVLSLRMESLKATMGQGFINLFTPIVHGLNSILEHLSDVAEGFKDFTEVLTGKSDVTEGLGNIASDAQSAAGDIENIASAAVEAKRELAGFDEITRLGSVDTETQNNTSGNVSTDITVNGADEAAGTVTTLSEAMAKEVETLRELVSAFKIGDFFTVGKDVSQLVVDINEFIADAIAGVDWEQLGEDVGEFLKGIEWLKVFKSIKDIISSAIEGAVDFWFESLKEAPFETGLITAIGLWTFTGFGKNIANKIGKAITGSIPEGGFTISSALKAALKVLVAFQVGGAVGYKLGEMLMEAINPELESFYKEFSSIADVGKYIFQDGLVEGFKDIFYALDLDEMFGFISEEIKRQTQRINKQLETIELSRVRLNIDISTIEEAFTNASGLVDEYFELSMKVDLTDEDIEKLGELKTGIEGFAELPKKYIDPITGAWKGTKDELSKVIEEQKKYLDLQAYQDAYVQAKENLIILENTIGDLESQISDKEIYSMAAKWFDSLIEQGYTIDEIVDKYTSGIELLFGIGKISPFSDQVIKDVAAIYKSMQKANKEYKTQKKYIEQIEGELGALQDAGKEATKQTFNSVDEMVEDMKRTAKEMGVDLSDTFVGTWNKFSESAKKSTNESTNTIKAFGNTSAYVLSSIPVAKISVDKIKAMTDVRDFGISTADTIGSIPSAKILVDKLKALTDVESFGISAGNIVKADYTAKIKADIDSGKNSIGNIQASLSGLVKGIYMVDIGVKENSLKDAVGKIESKLRSISLSLDFKSEAADFGGMLKGALSGMAGAVRSIGTITASTITAHKNGGFIEDGLFTMNKGEIAGEWFDGKSAVANNFQITEGISNAVGPAVFDGVIKAMHQAPPLAVSGSGSDSALRNLDAAVQTLVQENKSGREMLAVLKEIMQLVREKNVDITLDGESIKNDVVSRINRNTLANGVCEINY